MHCVVCYLCVKLPHMLSWMLQACTLSQKTSWSGWSRNWRYVAGRKCKPLSKRRKGLA